MPRQATASQWTAANFVLASNEVGQESDTGLTKTGDGSTAWNSLPYTNSDVAPVTLTTALTLPASPNVRYTYLLGSGAAPNLPTAVGNTSKYVLKNTTGSSISLTTTSSQTIDGGAAPINIGPYASLNIVSDNANWWLT